MSLALPFVSLSDGVTVALDAAYWAVTGTLTGYLLHRVPAERLDRDGPLTRLHAAEAGGALHRRWFRIHRWKDALPEAGALFPGGVSKRRLGGVRPEDLTRFLIETRRAELVHWLAAAWVFPMVLWNRPALLGAMLAYALLANAPFALIQRHNRARILAVLRQRRARGVASPGHSAPGSYPRFGRSHRSTSATGTPFRAA